MIGSVLSAYNPDDVKPGWVAFGLVIALCVATYLLWRSMNSQLRKIQMPPRQSRDTRIPQSGETRHEPPTPDPLDSRRADDDRSAAD